ncbi:hypothetical protein H0H92_008070, partial [Tricholoma furcatifolium]
DVYFAVNVITGDEVSVKLEPIDTKESSLRLEQDVYKVLRDVEGIPKMLWFGSERGYRVLIMNLLGPSLADIFQAFGCSFTLNTVLMLGIQLLTRIEHIHDCNIIHCDIKPDNLLTSQIPDSQGNSLIHIIDLGLARQYQSSLTANPSYQCKIKGTLRYLSINSHLGIEPSRRDDLESLTYVLIYFLCSSLPWQRLEASSRQGKASRILQIKTSMTSRKLCADLPSAIQDFLDYV